MIPTMRTATRNTPPDGSGEEGRGERRTGPSFLLIVAISICTTLVCQSLLMARSLPLPPSLSFEAPTATTPVTATVNAATATTPVTATMNAATATTPVTATVNALDVPIGPAINLPSIRQAEEEQKALKRGIYGTLIDARMDIIFLISLILQLIVLHTSDALRQPAANVTLLFNHLPKAGGSSIRNYLRTTIGKSVSSKYAFETGSSLPRDKWVLVPEFGRLTEAQRQRFFTVGLVREPCSYYLSLWSFGSKGEGAERGELARKGLLELYGKLPPYNNADDLERFHAWIEYEQGLLTKRFKQSYGNVSNARIDCWIHTETLYEDFQTCMANFRHAGGWTTNALPKIRVNNPSNHSSCHQYYNTTTQDLVLKHEKAFYNVFSYAGCCGGLSQT